MISRLPDITKYLAQLCEKMRVERAKILEDNEKHLKEEAERRKKGEKSDDEDEDGFVDDEDDNDDDDDENSILQKLSNFKRK